MDKLVHLNDLISTSSNPALVIGRCRNETDPFFPKVEFPNNATIIYLTLQPLTGNPLDADVIADFDDFKFVEGITPGKLRFIWFDYSTFKFFRNAKKDSTTYFKLLAKLLVSRGHIYLPFPEIMLSLTDDIMAPSTEFTWTQFMEKYTESSLAMSRFVPTAFQFSLDGLVMPSPKALGRNMVLFNECMRMSPQLRQQQASYVSGFLCSLRPRGVFSYVTYNHSSEKHEFVTELGFYPNSTEKKCLKFGYFTFEK